ncbi:MAG: hypothetical protein QOG49_1425, partial [Frankiaceae bacterium]|nr:hypothetical protein [Frankiaceae bacterium]
MFRCGVPVDPDYQTGDLVFVVGAC